MAIKIITVGDKKLVFGLTWEALLIKDRAKLAIKKKASYIAARYYHYLVSADIVGFLRDKDSQYKLVDHSFTSAACLFCQMSDLPRSCLLILKDPSINEDAKNVDASSGLKYLVCAIRDRLPLVGFDFGIVEEVSLQNIYFKFKEIAGKDGYTIYGDVDNANIRFSLDQLAQLFTPNPSDPFFKSLHQFSLAQLKIFKFDFKKLLPHRESIKLSSPTGSGKFSVQGADDIKQVAGFAVMIVAALGMVGWGIYDTIYPMLPMSYRIGSSKSPALPSIHLTEANKKNITPLIGMIEIKNPINKINFQAIKKTFPYIVGWRLTSLVCEMNKGECELIYDNEGGLFAGFKEYEDQFKSVRYVLDNEKERIQATIEFSNEKITLDKKKIQSKDRFLLDSISTFQILRALGAKYKIGTAKKNTELGNAADFLMGDFELEADFWIVEQAMQSFPENFFMKKMSVSFPKDEAVKLKLEGAYYVSDQS
jgi:hypothetical protein